MNLLNFVITKLTSSTNLKAYLEKNTAPKRHSQLY